MLSSFSCSAGLISYALSPFSKLASGPLWPWQAIFITAGWVSLMEKIEGNVEMDVVGLFSFASRVWITWRKRHLLPCNSIPSESSGGLLGRHHMMPTAAGRLLLKYYWHSLGLILQRNKRSHRSAAVLAQAIFIAGAPISAEG